MKENKLYKSIGGDETINVFQWNGETEQEQFPEFMRELFENKRIAFLEPKDANTKLLLFTVDINKNTEANTLWESYATEIGEYIVKPTNPGPDTMDWIYTADTESLIEWYVPVEA